MGLKIDGSLLLVGAGNMGYAMLDGWLKGGLEPARIIVQEPAPPPRAAEILRGHGIEARTKIGQLSEPPAVIVVAVKPQVMDEVFPQVAAHAGEKPWSSLSRPAARWRASRNTCRRSGP